MTTKVKNAKGQKGFLLYEGDGRYAFRVYDKSHPDGFIDYNIYHNDLEVEIIDELATFYYPVNQMDFANQPAPYLDNPPETLGRTDCEYINKPKLKTFYKGVLGVFTLIASSLSIAVFVMYPVLLITSVVSILIYEKVRKL